MVSLSLFKASAAVATFVIAILSGIPALWSFQNKPESQLLPMGLAFASGIFLGAGLLHLLPDAVHEFTQLFAARSFLYAGLVAAFGFLSLLVFERIIHRIQEMTPPQEQRIFIYHILLIILSIHSVMEGFALGVNLVFATTMILFIAIMAHKGLASFALSMKLLSAGTGRLQSLWLIALFACMTPLGIFLGSMLSLEVSHRQGIFLAGLFNAFAAGSFLYIATLHTLDELLNRTEKIGWFEVIAILLGLASMAILTLWI